jgi:hypothetical protein
MMILLTAGRLGSLHSSCSQQLVAGYQPMLLQVIMWYYSADREFRSYLVQSDQVYTAFRPSVHPLTHDLIFFLDLCPILHAPL